MVWMIYDRRLSMDFPRKICLAGYLGDGFYALFLEDWFFGTP